MIKSLEERNKEFLEEKDKEWRIKHKINNSKDELNILIEKLNPLTNIVIEYKNEWRELRLNHWLKMDYFSYRSLRTRKWKTKEEIKTYNK